MIKIYFKYKAFDDNGTLIEGVLKSKSKVDAKLILIEKNLTPINLTTELKLYNKISQKDLYLYCRKLSSLLAAGINIKTSMEILEEESENIILKIGSSDIVKSISNGESLSKAMENTGIYPVILVNMVRVGEETGKLDIVINKMSDYFYKEYKIKNKFKNALIYPIILVLLTIIISLFLFIYIVPQFKEIFISNDINLPLLTRFILSISDILINIPMMLMSIPLFIFVIIIVVNSKMIKPYYDKYKIKYSIFRDLNRKKAILNILTPLSMMYMAAIPIIEIFSNIKEMNENIFVKDKLDKIIKDISKGNTISYTFKKSGLFTKMIDTSIKVGEETGNLDSVLVDINDFYEDDIVYTLDKYVLILEPMIIIVVGILIGSVTIGLVLPILSLMNSFI